MTPKRKIRHEYFIAKLAEGYASRAICKRLKTKAVTHTILPFVANLAIKIRKRREVLFTFTVKK